MALNTIETLIKYNIILMKIQGLMVMKYKHTGKIEPSSCLRRHKQIEDNDQNTLNTHEQFDVDEKFNKIHLIYCVVISLFKIYCNSINTLFGKIPSYSQSIYGTNNFTRNDSTNTKDDFANTISSVAGIIIYLEVPFWYIFILVATSIKNGYLSSCKSFDNAEKLIADFYNECNNHYKEKPEYKRLEYSYKKWFLYFSIVYLFISLPVIIGISFYNFYNAFLYAFVIVPRSTIIGAIFNFFIQLSLSLLVADIFTMLYFIIAQILLARIQFKAFNTFVIRLIELENHQEKAKVTLFDTSKDITLKNEVGNVKFDVEVVRSFYNELCENVIELDSWVCYMYGIIYVADIPSLCLFLYSVLMTSESFELLMAYIQIILLIVIQLLTLTIPALGLNTTSTKFIEHLYKIDSNKMKNDKGIEKLQLFLTQTKNNDIGITIGKLLMIDPTSVGTIIGAIASYFLLIIDLKDKLH